MIINNSYFQGNLQVPNSQDALTPLSDRRGNKVNLEDYIARYEREVMIFALGFTQYKDFINQFENDGTLKVGATQKWVDFTNGKEYQVDGEDFEWKGLRFKEGSQDYSLIAEYVYSKFLPDISNILGSAGVQKNNAKASRGYSSIPRTVEAWNSFIAKYQGDYEENTLPVFVQKGSLIGLDYSAGRNSDYIVSMYQYLQDNEVTYDGVNTKLFEPENSFGI